MYRVADAVFGAMAALVPDGVTAAGEGGSYLMRISGADQAGREFLCVDLVQGTWGARASRDGIDGLANMQANHTNTPVEALEANFPIRVERHSLVPDTGGLGKFRGGLSIERSWRYLGSRPGVFRSRSDRRRFPPYGLFGGQAGAPSRLTLERLGKEPVEMDSKAVFELLPGDLVTLRIAGGGGWGAPSERAPALIAADLKEGKISAERARSANGTAG
jgi:N-methylhydantoinase B